ncbi:TlpA disulfide reductase family protein [Pinibacter soli]|uniref:TlpA disulfide reductase family protein n=1 Tax=Pinibacter soli TaxID=3044211 RepID=A0ABT6REV3_9BACT|nr:TlpA disulfide reductase family protein [Pinibacter soli]MDI3320946.1 TlpA disulfide reductase family protein [Pinibacter soli]
MNRFRLMGLMMLAMPFAAHSQTEPRPLKDVNISGKFVNVEDKFNKILMFWTEDGTKHVDSADVVNGAYQFHLQVTAPLMVAMIGAESVPGRRTTVGIMMNGPNSNKLDVYVEPGNLKITSKDRYVNFTVSGSKSHTEYEKLNKKAMALQVQTPVLNKVMFDKNATAEEKQAAKEGIIKEQAMIREEVYGKYIKENPQSPIYFYAFSRAAGGSKEDLRKALDLYKTLPENLRNSPEGLAFAKRTEGQLTIMVGSIAPDITLNTPDGIPVALSSFRGKYVLLDFWASWCGPCRKENPNVVQAYGKFKDKNFTVYSVSLDKGNDKDKWIKAIETDHLGAWTNVSDLKYWGSEAALKYGITGIPQNFLIDPKGKIIATNLRGEALEKKLEEVL